MDYLIPPQNQDAEMSVISALMREPDRIEGVAAVLDPDDFYSNVNNAIYKIILDINAVDMKPDVLTVASLMSDRKTMFQGGEEEYLTYCEETLPSAQQCDHYVSIIREKAVRRLLLNAGRQCMEHAMTEQEGIDSCILASERQITEVSDKYNGLKSDGRTDDPDEIFTDVLCEPDSEQTPSLDIGYPVIDSMSGGIKKQDMIVLAGRPSQGKTTLAINILENLAKQGHKVLIFTLETSRQQIYMNLLASNKGAFRWKMTPHHRNKLTDIDRDYNKQAHERIKELKIIIRDEKYLYRNVRNIRSYISQERKKGPIGMVVIDQFTLMEHKHGENRQDLNMQISSKYIQAMCKDLQIPVLLLHQLSRGVEKENREPRLSDLRECGSLEEDADLVLFIQRPKDSDLRDLNRNVFVAKAKLGTCGRTSVVLNPNSMRFSTPQSEFTKLDDMF